MMVGFRRRGFAETLSAGFPLWEYVADSPVKQKTSWRMAFFQASA